MSPPARRGWLYALIAFLLMSLGFRAAASAEEGSRVVVITEQEPAVRAGKFLDLYVDKTERLDLAAARRMFIDGNFEPSALESPSYGFTNWALWGRITIEDLRATPEPLVLQLAYAPLDRLEVYAEDAPDKPLAVVGDALPFDARTFKHRYPNVLLPAKKGRAVYYLRASGDSSLMMPLRVFTVPAYTDDVVTDQAAQALYVGIMLALIAYNLFLYFGVREVGYLLYSVFITLYLIYQSSMGGMTFQYLWPNNTWLPQRMMAISVGSAAICGKLFVGHFLGTREATPRLHRIMQGFVVAYVIYLPFGAFGPARIAFPSTAALALIFSFVVLAVAASRLRRGGRPARVFILAWGFFLIGNILAALRLTGVAPANFLTENSQQLGSALEGVLLSLGLADRIRVLRVQNEREQRERALEREQTANELQLLNDELRRQIVERSREMANLLQEVARGNAAELTVGGNFDGRYLIRRPLARGGMGSVYEVERTSDHKQFALKVLMGGDSPTVAARFAREAEIAASLRHPQLVAIVDFGISEGRTMFLVMELVQGPSLEAERERFGQLDWGLPILSQTALGLVTLHACGVVHRDLKPSNVLLAPQAGGQVHVKIADFGLSRVQESFGSREPGEQRDGPATLASVGAVALARPMTPSPRNVTLTGTFLGTPHYMAPELASGARAVHPSADVFSFGVMAYEVVTGQTPFASPPLYDRLAGRRLQVPARLSQLCPSVDGRLAELLDAALREDPGERPKMGDFVRVFDAL